ncbi:hypothetical protein A3A03_01740 [Candidatus Nomurabacteria bacterium RIFCSPLOWO2_01_FULL_40_18]|uniref:Uncharacterized protein n=1 Tax=Candidatus Nomurabacteria bacterium RIFCSPLOWO2_01_FULL_40_18 TaxID=1801773 RepID=A0A1F6XLY2_9BACT|nr:MAG: hypothetical protein A3A03_01740 [Candidatus Nomurabacteria bacterium RIFCSPLOWO2_01_FULL_40_18]
MSKNKKLIILSLIVIILGLFVVFYSPKYSSPPPAPLRQYDLSITERNQALAELRKVISKSPPLTTKERSQALTELKKLNQTK